jgi:hypothetical protein
LGQLVCEFRIIVPLIEFPPVGSLTLRSPPICGD